MLFFRIVGFFHTKTCLRVSSCFVMKIQNRTQTHNQNVEARELKLFMVLSIELAYIV